jgi:hypothetical protein
MASVISISSGAPTVAGAGCGRRSVIGVSTIYSRINSYRTICTPVPLHEGASSRDVLEDGAADGGGRRFTPRQFRARNALARGRGRSMRRPRAGFVPPHPGGSGAPPGRHYDRSARSSLDWDRPRRLTPAKAASQEARPGAELRPFGAASRAASGAPKGATPSQEGVHLRKVAPIGALSPSHFAGVDSPGPLFMRGPMKGRRTRRLDKKYGR